jgi:tellurite resistance protein TerC
MLVAAQEAANYADFAVPAWVWLAFLAGFIGLLLVDVLVIHRTAHVVTTRQAAIESAVWIAIGLSFSLVILAWQGTQAAGEYVAGYLIEESLSIDNVFVWALILSFFAVPRAYQHRVLFWGIFGALIARAAFIFGGVALLDHFDGVIYIFGAILLITAVRLLLGGESEVNPESNPLLRIFRRVIPSTPDYDGHRLLTRKTGVLLATPLLAVVVVVETSDVVFAVDSIPAILAVTREEFVVYTSNAFAILGLRALYFLLADLKDRFEYLRHGLAVILAFVGVKMLIAEWVYIPVGVSLAVIAAVLVVSVVISARHDQVPEGDLEPADQHDE